MNAPARAPRAVRANRPTPMEWLEYDTKPEWVMPPAPPPPLWPVLAIALALAALAACVVAM